LPNYSYDPVREYLQFVDKKNFTFNGILTDSSVTTLEAIGMNFFLLNLYQFLKFLIHAHLAKEVLVYFFKLADNANINHHNSYISAIFSSMCPSLFLWCQSISAIKTTI